MAPKIKWNIGAFKELRQSTDVQKVVEDAADSVRARAAAVSPGREYEVSSRVGTNRARSIVYPKDPAAIRSNQKHNSLLKGLGGG